MRLAVIGAGYVGLTSGVCLASLGHHVTVCDLNLERIASLQAGRLPIVEEGLETLLHENAARLTFTGDIAAAVHGARVVMLAVGTPPDPYTGEADLSAVFAAAESALRALPAGADVTFVTKSTVPAGTGDRLEARLSGRADVTARAASNPEFLREGFAVQDFLRPDRIVAGCPCDASFADCAELYKPLTDRGAKLMRYSRTTAELIKYASNGFLAVKIAYINEMADLCEALGADAAELADGMGADSRIGRAFLNVGPGYGGSCFPKDTLALREQARRTGTEVRLIDAVIDANDRRVHHLIREISALLSPGSFRDRRICILGAAFKAGTDDVRESPALRLAARLLSEGVAWLNIADPVACENAARQLPPSDRLRYTADPLEAARGADLIICATEWPEFRRIPLSAYKAAAAEGAAFYDLRRVFSYAELKQAGFRAKLIGRR